MRIHSAQASADMHIPAPRRWQLQMSVWAGQRVVSIPSKGTT